MLHCKAYRSIADIPAETWDGLFASDNPFVSHAFLLAMESSGCAGRDNGWHPRHMLLSDDRGAVAAMPLYRKDHSYGEFVFDWGWAEAFARHGLEYYPKLVTAVPYSPVRGPRIGIARGSEPAPLYRAMHRAVRDLSEAEHYSSWHLLFPDDRQRRVLHGVFDGSSLLRREAVQFHWFNREYRTFDDFLASLRSSRRKNIRRERRRVEEQGITLIRKSGRDVSDDEWRGFFACYQDTYRKRSGHDGYLNQAFFARLRERLADKLLMVIARAANDGRMLASSLFLHDGRCLYGRYWGALEDVSCLHFEACLYQGIEFCIERGLTGFDPGTQGEHKLLRGFEPIKSASFHWIADARFAQAIGDFLDREIPATDAYRQRAADFLPYRKTGGASDQ